MPVSQLFLLDAHALCYRAYYAIKSLSTSKGLATNAVYGFVSTFKKILRDFKPQYIAVCFDVEGKTHRQKKYAEYKVQRPVMPDNLVSQIPIIKDVVRAFNLPVFEFPGFEADDVIASVTKKFKSKELDIVIVSDDKDMYQLMDETVKVYSPRKEKILSIEDVKMQVGVDPHHIPDFLALAGDKVDNIPGVEGIGEVSAKNLINYYGDLTNIFNHIEQLDPARVRDRLKTQRDVAFFSKELVLLDADIPIDFSLEDLALRDPDREKLFAIFSDLEFRRLAAEFSDHPAESENIAFKELKAERQIQDFISLVKEKKQFSFLFDHPFEGSLSLIPGQLMLAVDPEDIYFINESELTALQPIFEDDTVLKITHNFKEKLKILDQKSITVKGKIFDGQLAGYLLSPSRSGHDIPALSWQYLKTSVPEVKNSREDKAAEIRALANLWQPLLRELKEKSLVHLFENIEVPLATVLFRMEKEGVCLDVSLLDQLSKECNQKLESLVKNLFEIAGQEFNLNSPKQLSQVLFEKLKLPALKKTKTGYSTNEEVLVRLAEQHPLPALILEYRQLTKLKSTYIDTLPKQVDPHTNKIHASFNQIGAETGRLSSNNPNLQNIPIRTELGRKIRKAFIASSDYQLIAADYSQIELRILAHLSQDENLKKAFQADQDIHAFTAAQIFEIPESEVTTEMRNSAKRVNFGIIYGISAFGLAKDLDINQSQAQDFIDRYFLRYPKVKVFMDQEIEKCEKQGFVTTLLNRRRYLPEITSKDMAVRQFAQRQAINTPVQGTAADLMKLAMINIQNELDKRQLKSKMIITVHDELVFDGPLAEESDMLNLIKEHMENTLSLSIPIRVSIKKGKNWLEMEKV